MRMIALWTMTSLLAAFIPISSFATPWEYKQVDKPCTPTQVFGYVDGQVCGDIPLETLNSLGAYGWELSACPVDDWSWSGSRSYAISKYCLFKRRRGG